MFYCDGCAKKDGFHVYSFGKSGTFGKSYGRCEVCGTRDFCTDIKATPKKKTKAENDDLAADARKESNGTF